MLAQIHNAHCTNEENLTTPAACDRYLRDWAPRVTPIVVSDLTFLHRYCKRPESQPEKEPVAQ